MTRADKLARVLQAYLAAFEEHLEDEAAAGEAWIWCGDKWLHIRGETVEYTQEGPP